MYKINKLQGFIIVQHREYSHYFIIINIFVVSRSCLTLCDPIDCSPPGSSVHGDSPGKNTGVGCHALLQGIFPTQGSNPGIEPRSPTLQADSLLSEPLGKPKNTGVGSPSYPFSRGSFLPRNLTVVSFSAGERWSQAHLCPMMTSMCGPGQVSSCFLTCSPPIKWGDSYHVFVRYVISLLTSRTKENAQFTQPIQDEIRFLLCFPSGSLGKESACNGGDLGSIPGWGRSPGREHVHPFQYSCL